MHTRCLLRSHMPALPGSQSNRKLDLSWNVFNKQAMWGSESKHLGPKSQPCLNQEVPQRPKTEKLTLKPQSPSSREAPKKSVKAINLVTYCVSWVFFLGGFCVL